MKLLQEAGILFHLALSSQGNTSSPCNSVNDELLFQKSHRFTTRILPKGVKDCSRPTEHFKKRCHLFLSDLADMRTCTEGL